MRKFILFSLIVLVCGFILSSQTWASLSPAAVTLEKAVHFMTVDGSDVVVQPGTYMIEAAEEWLRVIPDERRDALLLEAHHTQHEEALQTPKAVIQVDEQNEIHIVLLLPGGQGLEAIGAESGVRSRAVNRPLISQTTSQQKQASSLPPQSKKSTVVQHSKPILKDQSAPFNPLYLRVQSLEQQVETLKNLVNVLQGQLNTITSAIQVDNAGNVTIGQAGRVTLQGNIVKINAASIDAQTGMSKFSGVVQADTVVTNSVVSSSYTPGAGNIW
jgi:hypothetical protein